MTKRKSFTQVLLAIMSVLLVLGFVFFTTALT